MTIQVQVQPQLPTEAVFFIEIEPAEPGTDHGLINTLIDILANLCTIEDTGGMQHANSDLSAY